MDVDANTVAIEEEKPQDQSHAEKHEAIQLAMEEEKLKQLIAQTIQQQAAANCAKLVVSQSKAKTYFEWVKSAFLVLTMATAGFAAYTTQLTQKSADKDYNTVREVIGQVNERLEQQNDDTKRVTEYVKESTKAVAEAVEEAPPAVPVTHDGVTYGCVRNEHGNLICTKVVEMKAAKKPVPAALPKPPAIARHEPIEAPPKRAD